MSEGRAPHTSAQLACRQDLELGEGVTWDPIRGEVLWVDITTGRIFHGRLASDGTVTVVRTTTVPGTAGAVAVARDGSLVVAGSRGLIYVRPDGSTVDGPQILPDALTPGRRLNDGKADPAGRFLVGTQTDAGGSRTELLVRVGTAGSVTVLDDDLALANGLGWSVGGDLLYTVDTLDRVIYVREYDATSGAVGARRVFAGPGVFGGPGLPDGMTIDAEGFLWVAIWGGSRVVRLDPGGRFAGSIYVPAPHVSCVEFVGRDLLTLAITTAREGLSLADLAARPLSGSLFTVRPGVRGRAPSLWSASSSRPWGMYDAGYPSAPATGTTPTQATKQPSRPGQKPTGTHPTC